MTIRNSKTERVHRALRTFINPKLRPGASLELTPFFYGVTDDNVGSKIDDIVGAVARATCGDLVYDASTPELRRKMKAAVEEDGTTTKEASNGVDQSVIDRILALLEHKLLPTELAAVRQILTKPAKKQPASHGPEDRLGEDARNARLAYDARFPNAARIKVEPNFAPAPQPTAASNPAGYFERFPNARRIGLA